MQKKIFVIVALLVLSATAVFSQQTPDSLLMFFSAKFPYSETGDNSFRYDGPSYRRILDYLKNNPSSVGWIRGYATKQEGWVTTLIVTDTAGVTETKSVSRHNELKDQTLGDWRASVIVVDELFKKNPWLVGRIHFLPAVVDSTVRGVEFWVMPGLPKDNRIEILTEKAKADSIADAAATQQFGKVEDRLDCLEWTVETVEGDENDHSLAKEIPRLKEEIRRRPRMWETGAGMIGCSFNNNTDGILVPAVALTINLSQGFGIGFLGGTCPLDEKSVDGFRKWVNAVNVCVFGRLGNPMGTSVLFKFGYANYSETVGTLEWLEGQEKFLINGWFIGGQLDVSLGRNWKISPAAAMVNSRTEKYGTGFEGSLVISKSW